MPLGLDGNSLAFAAKATADIDQAYRQGQLDAIKLAEAMRGYETGGLKDLYLKERMPVEFVEANAKSAQNILPIDWERINQLSGNTGARLVEGASKAPPAPAPVIQNQRMAPIDASQIQLNPQRAYQDLQGLKGAPAPSVPSEEDKYFEQALSQGQKRKPQGEPEEINVDLGVSKFKSVKQRELYLQSLKPEVQQIADLATRNKESRARVFSKDVLSQISDQQLSQLILEASSEEELTALQEALGLRSGNRSPQGEAPKQPLGLGSANLMRIAGQVDPMKDYISTQEKDILEKSMGLEAQKIAAGLRAQNQIREGDANRVSQQSIENARIAADLSKAQSKQELDVIKAELDARYKALSLADKANKTPATRGGSGRAQPNLELEERKRIDANLDTYKKIKAATPYMTGKQKKEMFNTYLLPEYNSAQFPNNKTMIYNLAPEVFKANGVSLGGAAPQSAGLTDKLKAVRTLKNNMAKVQSVPRATFDSALQRLKSQGVSDGDIESLRAEFAGKVK